MAQFPALPLWTDAYLGDTTHLTTIEHGAYLLLLMAMWRSPGCKLPNDPILLARYSKLTGGQWRRIGPILMPFFNVDEMWLTQGRLTDEAILVRQLSRKQSDNARARWLKNKESAYAMAMPDACQTDAPTPLTTPTVKKERVLTAGMNGKRVKKEHPRHGARSKDRRFIYFLRGTPEFVSYSRDFEEVRGAIPQATEFGRWFRYSGEKL